jgi:saccharopine dehydrogenase-like NADP-dependent oxidoreductase
MPFHPMRNILIIGAGRSASSLIKYLIDHAAAEQWHLTVADRDENAARALVDGAGTAASALALDAGNAEQRAKAIGDHDLVISMLPASMHMDVVKDCLRLRRHVITPSYVPDALWAMDADLKDVGIVALNELGLDPGIDHMSAMRILDRMKAAGGKVLAFESYCGGLVAPASDDNPWGYKFSWNPRNVVLAGQGAAARYVQDGQLRYIPYHRLFSNQVRVEVPGYGAFDGYANRDSLKYRKLYGIEQIPTLVRGTLRREGFCEAWDCFVQLGCTDDSYAMELPEAMTWAGFFGAFLPAGAHREMRDVLARYLGLDAGGATLNKLEWLGVFSDEPANASPGSPAAILQQLLERKWVLRPEDKDMVVMQHLFLHEEGGRRLRTTSSLVVEGTDRVHTAMARTVGLPVAMAARLLLNGGITDRGVLLPLKPALYDPILDELEGLGVRFEESVEAV